jgi:hypothetical protein
MTSFRSGLHVPENMNFSVPPLLTSEIGQFLSIYGFLPVFCPFFFCSNFFFFFFSLFGYHGRSFLYHFAV